jgi:hypothetical protein
MMPSVLWAGSAGAAEDSETWVYSTSVKWPTPASLRRAEPDRLLAVRADEPGGSYMESLRRFRLHPGDATWDALQGDMETYAEKICEATGQNVKSGLFVTHLMAGKRLALGIAAAGVAADRIPGLASLPLAARVVTIAASAVATLYAPTLDLVSDGLSGSVMRVPVRANRGGEFRLDLPAV